jgi:hypothetical protein
MYWHNPKIRSSERVGVPSDDEEAIRMLAGHPDSATFVSEYAELRRLGTPIELALVSVGHEKEAEAARVHAGAASRARVSDQEGEAECHWVQAAFGGAPPRGRLGFERAEATKGPVPEVCSIFGRVRP